LEVLTIIRIDPISQAFIFIAGAIIVYLAPYGIELFTPLALLTVSVALLWVMGKKLSQDASLDSGEQSQIVGYTILGMAALFIMNMVGTQIFQVPITDAIFLDAMLFGVLYAIVETLFFQGAILSFALWKTKSFFLAILLSALVFLVYHFKRYGGSESSMFTVLAAGVILGLVAWRSRRLSPVILIHVLNNVIAVVMTQ